MTIILATGIATGCVYALVGIGFSLIYRTTGIVNFAQGVFVALGGMTAYWLLEVRLELPGGGITGQYALMILATLAIVAGVGAFLKWSTLGRAMRACAASRETSQLLGISPEWIGAVSMTATAALGGLGGILIAPAQYTSSDATTYGIF